MKNALLSALAAALAFSLFACGTHAPQITTEAAPTEAAPAETAVTENAAGAPAETVTDEPAETVTEAVTEDPVVSLLTSGAELEYTAKRKLFISPKTVGGVEYRQLQGGCTDGKYMYFAMNDTKSEGSCSLIYKIPIGAKKPEMISEPLQMDHSNDMTYDSKNHRLVVCNNAPNKQRLSFVDPDTLTLAGTYDLPFKAYCVQYVSEKDQYVIGVAGTMDIAVTDADFKELQRLPGEKTGYTKQGVDADENYIYYVQYNKNCIVICDWDGQRVAIIDLPVTGCEPENIFHANGQFYIGCASGGLAVYEIYLAKKGS